MTSDIILGDYITCFAFWGENFGNILVTLLVGKSGRRKIYVMALV